MDALCPVGHVTTQGHVIVCHVTLGTVLTMILVVCTAVVIGNDGGERTVENNR